MIREITTQPNKMTPPAEPDSMNFLMDLRLIDLNMAVKLEKIN